MPGGQGRRNLYQLRQIPLGGGEIMRHVEAALIRAIKAQADHRRGALAADLVDAVQDDKEAILAEMDFDAWLANACQDCLEGPNLPYI
jgi:hypothetical protein